MESVYTFKYFKNSKKHQFHWDQKIKSNTLCLRQSLLTSHRSLSDNLQHVATGHQEFRKGSREIGHPLANIRTLQRGIIRDHHPIIYVYVFIYLYRHMLATERDEAHQRVVKCLIIRNMLPMSSYFLDHPGIRGIESLSWTSWTFWPGHQGYFQGSNAFSESWIEVASRNHHIGRHPKNDKALNLSEVL